MAIRWKRELTEDDISQHRDRFQESELSRQDFGGGPQKPGEMPVQPGLTQHPARDPWRDAPEQEVQRVPDVRMPQPEQTDTHQQAMEGIVGMGPTQGHDEHRPLPEVVGPGALDHDPDERTFFGGRLSEADLHSAGMIVLGAAGAAAGFLPYTPFTPIMGYRGGQMLASLLGGSYMAGVGRTATGMMTGESELEALGEGIETMRDDLLWSMGFMSIGSGVRRGLGNFAGFDETQVRETLQRVDATLPREQAGRLRQLFVGDDTVAPEIPSQLLVKGRTTQAYEKVVGVFPFVGTPMHKGKEKFGESIMNELNRSIDVHAPNVSLDSMGINVLEGARNAHRAFRAIDAQNYDEFFRIANELGDPQAIPMDRVKRSVSHLERIRPRPEGVREPELTELDRYIRSLQETSDFITPSEWRTIQSDLNTLARKGRVEGFDISKLAQVRQAMEEAPMRMMHPSGRAQMWAPTGREGADPRALDPQYARGRLEETLRHADVEEEIPRRVGERAIGDVEAGIRGQHIPRDQVVPDELLGIGRNVQEEEGMITALRNSILWANKFHAAGMARYSQPEAKLIKRTDPGILDDFGRRDPSLHPDELITKFLNRRSPYAWKNLRDLIGKDRMNDVAHASFSRAWTQASRKTGDGMVDFRVLERELGLHAEKGRSAFRELFRDTEFDGAKLERLVDLGKMYGSFNLREASSFVQRRVLLGGVAGVTGMATTYMAPGSLTVTIPALLLTRFGASRALGRRKMMDAYLEALDPSTSKSVARAAVGTLLNDLSPEEWGEFGITPEDVERIEREHGSMGDFILPDDIPRGERKQPRRDLPGIEPEEERPRTRPLHERTRDPARAIELERERRR